MPRPRKYRRVSCLPKVCEFGPIVPDSDQLAEVILSVDEFETIRLIDKFELSQEECSNYMSVARTTVQQIYTSARKKIAEALVNGYRLKIEGGDYVLGSEDDCFNHRECCKNKCLYQENKEGE